MSHLKDGGPAFPTPHITTTRTKDPNATGGYEDILNFLPGMSLRDWFASQALGSQGATWTGALLSDYDAMASRAYAIADAMLAAREK